MVVEYFYYFLEMFLPDLFHQVDQNIPPKFLEQELHAAITDKTIKVADKLAQVTLKSGNKELVYVHIEFETQPDSNTPERVYDYFTRVCEKHGKNVTALIIYNGWNVPKIFDRFEKNKFGNKLLYQFNTYIVKNQKETDLINNQNPFAIFVLGNLFLLQAKRDDTKLLHFKEKVYEIAVNRNYPKEKIEKLLTFVFDLMKQKPELEKVFYENIKHSLKQNDMTYIPDSARKLADVYTEVAYGETYSQLKAQTKAEIAQSKAEIAQSKAEIVQSKADKENAMVKLYTKLKISIEDIADTLALEPKFVIKVLKSKGLLKN